MSSSSKDEEEKELVAEAEFLKIDSGMLDLFRMELESQSQVMNHSLVAFEKGDVSGEEAEKLMRAAHSIKGAGRVVRLEPVVTLSHAMEDCFVAVQKGKLSLTSELVDILLEGVDIFVHLSKLPQAEIFPWLKERRAVIHALQENMLAAVSGGAITPKPENKEPTASSPLPPPIAETKAPPEERKKEVIERVLRVTAQNLNRLMGLAGESMVESRWLQPFSDSLMKLKKEQGEFSRYLDDLREYLEKKKQFGKLDNILTTLQQKVDLCRQGLVDRLAELDLFIVRYSSLSNRLYREVIDSRMRPFSDGIEGFPRMVRDLARRLNKKVRFECIGKNTPVDREILEKLEAPLGHLIRNSIDHGIESPEERIRLGKPEEGTITLAAEHRAGMLAITVSDDGRGVDLDKIRKRIVELKLIRSEMVSSLNEGEVLDFLFLPGFSTSDAVTDISGRGVGLNVLQTMIQEVSGSLRVTQIPGRGTTFHLQLPLTLSVIRALIVEIAKEPYAFPLSRIDRALTVEKEKIDVIENREYFNLQGENIGIVLAAQALGLEPSKYKEEALPIVVLSDRMNTYGLVVDRFLGERELVVQELDPRLGKVQDISSGAILEDGSPLLIFDVEDLVRSVDHLLSGGRVSRVEYGEDLHPSAHKKRILIVDDSITVREVECRLLRNYGYEVETAINGVDGWNAVRIGDYDLVVTDIDMPRMNGIELVKAIRADPRLKSLPVLIVSYKEREEDRQKGMDAGANHYLTKSSFHDETLIHVIQSLIGV